ncbi:MAG: WbuC family cupin fold metalloprotein [bacterium]|nr:WbuC family cupin fold metalloprotein [bacterium]
MKYRKENDEVFYAVGDSVRVTRAEVEFVKTGARDSIRGRCRLCLHSDPGAKIHQMLIAHTGGIYVRPHKHIGRSESFQLIDGALCVVVFDSRGTVTDVVSMDNSDVGCPFLYRIPADCFHTVLLLSSMVVFLETTGGPFNPSETVFAPWAPPVEKKDELSLYRQKLDLEINQWPDKK